MLTFDVTVGPTHGTLAGSGADRTYTPAADYHGPDSFTFTVTDPSGEVATGTVHIDVDPSTTLRRAWPTPTRPRRT